MSKQKLTRDRLRQIIREEKQKLSEANKHIDTAKNHANNLMTALTQAQMEDDGMRAGEITEMKNSLQQIITKLNRL